VSPHALEALYVRLGQPRWYWPTVGAALFALFVLGSSVSGVPHD